MKTKCDLKRNKKVRACQWENKSNHNYLRADRTTTPMKKTYPNGVISDYTYADKDVVLQPVDAPVAQVMFVHSLLAVYWTRVLMCSRPIG